MTSSGTSLPLSMKSFAFLPTSVPAATAARSMSPVDKCTTPNFSLMISHCVPLPDAGAPAMMMLTARRLVALLEPPELEKWRRTDHGNDLSLRRWLCWCVWNDDATVREGDGVTETPQADDDDDDDVDGDGENATALPTTSPKITAV